MDPQANATSGFGFRPKDIRFSIYDAMIDRVPVNDIIKATDIRYLQIIPSNVNLVGAEFEFVNLPSREFILRKILEPIGKNYEFIFIDCPPSLGLLTLNALAASDGVIIPLQTEYYAMEGIGILRNGRDQPAFKYDTSG